MSLLYKIKAQLLLALFTLGLCILIVLRGSSLPILMYHHLDPAADGSNSMTITPARFEEDMTFLQQQGYTPLLSGDLLAIKHGKARWPDKPVVITFDDGYASNYTYAYPILQKTGMKAIISVIASQISSETTPDAYMLSWPQCREMQQSGIIEIGCHTYRLHNNDNGGAPYPDGHDGVQRKKGEDHDAYVVRVGGDLSTGTALIRSETGSPCRYFSYPFGAGDKWFEKLLQENGYQMTTDTNSRMAHPFCGLYDLPRLHVNMSQSVSDLLST